MDNLKCLRAAEINLVLAEIEAMKTKICSSCKQEKQIIEFGASKENKDGVRGMCKACLADRRKKYREDNLEKERQRVSEWREKNRIKLNESRREWYKENREQQIAETKEWRSKLRSDVISYYGNKCACCGESRNEFLAIDHINGGGNIERKKLKLFGGSSFFEKE